MLTIQTDVRFSLSLVKPLERLTQYREMCLEATLRAYRTGTRRRQVSPVSGKRLEPYGRIGGLDYARCRESGSLFLAELPEPKVWRRLLSEASSLRQLPTGVHQRLASSRWTHVHRPKVAWIEETVRLQRVSGGRLMEAATGLSDLFPFLQVCSAFSTVVSQDEMGLAHPELEPAGGGETAGHFQAAVLLESLDRVDDPARLIRSVADRLAPGGLLFVTALVFSGFDMAVLGGKNLYLYPPDRANCFTLQGLRSLLEGQGLSLLEVSTPGVLDVEIVRAHLEMDPGLQVSPFERKIALSDETTRNAFQEFLQQWSLSSFARVVARSPA